MWGARVPFSAFFSTVETKIVPVMDYSIQLPKLILRLSSLDKRDVQVVKDILYPTPQGESEITSSRKNETLRILLH